MTLTVFQIHGFEGDISQVVQMINQLSANSQSSSLVIQGNSIVQPTNRPESDESNGVKINFAQIYGPRIAAKYLGVSNTTLNNLRKSGKIIPIPSKDENQNEGKRKSYYDGKELYRVKELRKAAKK